MGRATRAILMSLPAETENRKINVYAGVFKNKGLLLRDKKTLHRGFGKKKKKQANL